jgi:methionyl-tRNA formyltransferase
LIPLKINWKCLPLSPEGTLKEVAQENVQSSMFNAQLSTKETHSPLSTSHSPLKHAPKIFTETSKIDFSNSVEEVHNLIRGLSPFPGAFTYLIGKTLKILRSEKEIGIPESSPGQFETDNKTFLKFACKDGYILVKEIQLEGKKKMNVEDFLRGHHFK